MPVWLAPAIKYGLPLIGGLLGGKGGKTAAQASNQPTRTSSTSSLTPYGGWNVPTDPSTGNDSWMQDYLSGGGSMDVFNAGKGISPDLMKAASSYANYAQANPSYSGGTGAINYLLDEGYANYNAGSPEAERAFANYEQYTQDYLNRDDYTPGEPFDSSKFFSQNFKWGGGPEPNKWQRQVMNGYYLNRNNPALKELSGTLTNEYAEAYERGIVPQIDSTFTQAGVQDGGMRAFAQAMANEEYNEAVQNSIYRLFYDNYTNERGLMTNVLNNYSSNNVSAQIARMNAQTQEGIAAAGFSLQDYMQSKSLEQNQGQFDASFGSNSLANLFNMGQSVDNLDSQRLGTLSNLILPVLGQFGTQNQTGTTQGPIVGTSGGTAMGALSGLITGLGGKTELMKIGGSSNDLKFGMRD